MNSESKKGTISILGCGWLGLPLAENFIKAGFQVKGSTTSPEKLIFLAANGIQPYLINLKTEEPAPPLTSFLEADFLIVAFPPGIRAGNGAQYFEQIKVLVNFLKKAPVCQVVFISSTSVYPDLNKTVSETEDLTPTLPGNILLQAENLLREIKNQKTIILRLGGLVGGTRHPGRFLAGKQNLANPVAPVNLIHLDDCIGIFNALFQRQKWNEIYNGCADGHPSRQEFYTAAAQKLNLPLPHFAKSAFTDGFKIISNEKIKKDLSYRFIHPDPMLFI